jgi:hypothetical protein
VVTFFPISRFQWWKIGMKRILTIIAVVSVLAVSSCAQQGVPVLKGNLPTNASKSPDDFIFTPGGYAYRGPSIEIVEAPLLSGPEPILVEYRANITTKSGEIRHNLMRIRKQEGRFDGSERIRLYAVRPPPNMRLLQDSAVGLPLTLAQVLVIEVSRIAKPGRYDFEIGVKIEGKDYGMLPCSIEVTP